ncbi:hypothetical protein LCGC14_1404030 [marine sediment metagenome]|uniref:Uncharacterized protein n=1 Tax=marine sediment metagenome TaxID=412755 RepID=A0A0F9KH60_9ZZZZ
MGYPYCYGLNFDHGASIIRVVKDNYYWKRDEKKCRKCGCDLFTLRTRAFKNKATRLEIKCNECDSHNGWAPKRSENIRKARLYAEVVELRFREKRYEDLRCYGKRDRLIKSLGFDSYQDYLDSGFWKAIRNRILKRDLNSCTICGSPANQVHHLRYTPKVLLGIKTKWLKSICSSCHYTVEFSDGCKVTVGQAGKRTIKLIKKNNNPVGRKRRELSEQAPKSEKINFEQLQKKYPTVTPSLIDLLKSEKGGWSKIHLEFMGIPWPPKSGWKISSLGNLTRVPTKYQIKI